MLLAGLYISPKDPNQMIFLQHFVNEVNKLASESFSWMWQNCTWNICSTKKKC